MQDQGSCELTTTSKWLSKSSETQHPATDSSYLSVPEKMIVYSTTPRNVEVGMQTTLPRTAEVGTQTVDVTSSCLNCNQCNRIEPVTENDTEMNLCNVNEGSSSSQPSTLSNSDSQNSDRTYEYKLDDMSSYNDIDCSTETGFEQNIVEQRKYLVFENEIDKLFKICPDCKEDVSSIHKIVTGTMLTVSYKCTLGHTNVWRSQPSLRRMPSGNLLISAAILLSGSSYNKIQNFFSILRMPVLSESEFYRIQSTYLNPTINDYWTLHQTAILSVLSENSMVLCGDARSDSPGYSAK